MPALSRGLGELTDPAVEAAFQEVARPRLTHQLRLVALVQGVLYLSVIWMNWREFKYGCQFQILISLRVAVATLLGAAVILARPPRPFSVAQRLYLAAGILVVVTELIEYHFTAQLAGSYNSQQVPFILVVVLMTYVVAALPMWMVVSFALFGSVLFLGYQLAVSGPGATVTQMLLIYLLLANGVGYAFRLVWNQIARRDFTLHQELERAELEARQANAAKGRFLAVMSHEIRTPLNGVLVGVQLLQETALLPEQRQTLEVLARSGQQLAMLLDDILDLARIEAGHLDLAVEPFCPAELLASVHAVLYSQARAKGLMLRLDHPAGLPSALLGDVLRLRQVLINLVGNAVKFTGRGEVVLSLNWVEAPGQAGLHRCAFKVLDTGPGLDEEAKTRIFAPFEQGDMSIRRHRGGAGLGLAISRELVAAMGGELIVESLVGQGSVFSFTLTLPVGEVLETSVTQPAMALSLLVVDDLEANLIVAKGLLASLGHRARTAITGAEALTILQTDSFDAVLLDLHMQDMDDMEVFHGIRSDPRLADLPVFLVTADTERSRVQACLAEGMRGVLPKPIRKDRLAALLAGVPAPEERAALADLPLVDMAHVAQVLADLGVETWSAGVRACRTSAEACLRELEDPKALHRLAGLSASYGMTRLHQLVRHAETRVAIGEPFSMAELHALVASSLKHLEILTLEPSAQF